MTYARCTAVRVLAALSLLTAGPAAAAPLTCAGECRFAISALERFTLSDGAVHFETSPPSTHPLQGGASVPNRRWLILEYAVPSLISNIRFHEDQLDQFPSYFVISKDGYETVGYCEGDLISYDTE